MIIFSRDTLLVHNPKTAGTSLLQYLSEALPGPTYLAGVNELGTHHPHLDDAVSYARNVAGFDPAADDSRVLTVLRDAVDRERSMYVYYRNVLATSPTLQTDLPDPAMQVAVRQAEALSFEDWLVWQRDEFGHCDLWRSEYFYRCRDFRYPTALTVLRFERLADELSVLAAAQGWREVPLPRVNVSNRDEVQLGLSAAAEDFIHHSYRWMQDLPQAAFVP